MTDPTTGASDATDHPPVAASPAPGGDGASTTVGDDAPLDLDDVERRLDGVAVALDRLDDGSYWTDERTGDALPDDLLEADPIARRVP